MSGATEIEKKSLEAHVELCAERYSHLDQRIDAIDSKLNEVVSLIDKVHDMVANISDKRNNQLIGWTIGIIGCLSSIIGFLLVHYIIK